MGIIIGVDGSRNRSGGAKAHLIGILSETNSFPEGIEKIHLWSYKGLLDSIPDSVWLIKHNPPALEKSLLFQVFWQRFNLNKAVKKVGCDILLNTDAGTVSRFHPCVVMSRDMLSYEPNEMERYGFSLARLRLWLLKYAQARSMKMANGVIFLTQYAATVIQKFTGRLKNVEIIPHGISTIFKQNGSEGLWSKGESNLINCLYVSNVDLYKHQEKVTKAIADLRNKNYNIYLRLAGAKSAGAIQTVVDNMIKNVDPKGEFIDQLGSIAHIEIPVLLKETDIFIFASSCENMPNTLVEAMSSGLPIVCSNRGPMPEILKDGGVYFDPEDFVSIASAIKSVVDNKELRISIAKKAKEYSNSYSWSRCAMETWRFLIKVANQN